MKKITVLFILILFSCKSTTKNKIVDELEEVTVAEKVIVKVHNLEDTIAKDSLKIELVDLVLNELQIKKEQCKLEFVVEKVIPQNPDESIMVIPEIFIEEEEEYYFELNSYILIVDNKTGKIKHEFFESHKTNGWISDAIQLTDITIDTAPYLIKKGKRAFGIKVRFLGSSKPNPYGSEMLSLFIKDGKTLTRVLNNFEVNADSGEWDTTCSGNFYNVKKILIISDNGTNEYRDIIIKNQVTETEAFVDKKGKCDWDIKKSTVKTALKFTGDMYKETDL